MTSLNSFNPQYEHSVKTIYKHKMGVIASETFIDEDGFQKANVELKLKDLTPEVHQEWLRVNQPFFEDPVSPQLTLFPMKDNE